METEKGDQVGLATAKKIANIKSKNAAKEHKNNHKNVCDRRRKVPRQLAFKNNPDICHCSDSL
jgi:hypothetical protein